MRQVVLPLVILVFWLPARAWSADAKEDSKKMEGTWLPIEAELGGQKFPDEVLKTIKLTLGDGSYTVNVIDKGTVKLEPTKKPKAMDIVGTEGPNKGKTIPAIYELQGDTLRICYDLSGKNRPTEFKTEKDSKQFLVSYKREKK
jgi:uncharacterized protein (TIGR03067 family)